MDLEASMRNSCQCQRVARGERRLVDPMTMICRAQSNHPTKKIDASSLFFPFSIFLLFLPDFPTLHRVIKGPLGESQSVSTPHPPFSLSFLCACVQMNKVFFFSLFCRRHRWRQRWWWSQYSQRRKGGEGPVSKRYISSSS